MGLAEFWAEAGFYDVRIDDTQTPERIAARTIQWNSIPGSDQGIPIELIEAFASVPPGSVIQTAGTAAPSGWLMCDGASYLRASYPDLYTTIGTIYGAVDGTHFNVPDFRGRVPVGLGTHVDVDTLGENDGLGVSSRTPKHNHGLSIASDGGHSHTVNSHSHSISSDGGHSHAVDSHVHQHISPVGKAAAYLNIIDPGDANLDSVGNYANYDIRQVTRYEPQSQPFSAADEIKLVTSSAAAPGTNSVGGHSHGGATGNQNPGTNSVSSHSHSGSTVNVAAPPFIIVNYMIRT